MDNNENFDNPFSFYQNNMPDNNDNDNFPNRINYSEIFNVKDYFTILGCSMNNNKIIIYKSSLNKIATMINIIPLEYISFRNYKTNEKSNINLFQKENNEINIDTQENNQYLENSDSESDNELNDGFKRVDNLEDNLFDWDIYKKSFWFYLFLILCSIFDICFYLYIITQTIHKSHYFTIFTLIRAILLLFTSIFGLIKSNIHDFSGYIIKITTVLVPILSLIGIILYLASDIEFQLYWIKIIIDIVTMTISIILILFVTGIIKAEAIQIKVNNNQIDQSLISNYKGISRGENNKIMKF